ncbi:cytidine deaminase [Balneolales bacterium ANBcel1]|nr:cytidine deaminase [Balneolales bacterium ANBcel1]
MKPFFWNTLRQRCHIPHSDRNEVCLVEGRNGRLYPGVRVENISYPLSVDAVQAAIFSCLSEGDTPKKLLIPESGTDSIHGEERSEEKYGMKYPDQWNRAWIEWYRLDVSTHPEREPLDGERLFVTTENSISAGRLKKLTSHCVIPHSDFPVTALLLTDIGVFSGVNIEVPDWQKGLCAERVALAKAISCGATKFQEIHVYAPMGDYVSPCGACRQVMAEHMNHGQVTLYNADMDITILKVGDLLPYQFMASGLKKSSLKNE